MACFHPLACVGVADARTGKLSIRFSGPGEPMEVPCGQCIGCRLQRSLDWSIRLMHEAQLHEDNCFITLTYDPEFFPVDGSLVKSHFQDFLKRLRRRVEPTRFKFFHCGEYGEKFSRPHYHALLFGFDFSDRVLFFKRDGYGVFTSDLLSDVWGKGFCTVSDCTFESAAYVARYCVKKVTGEKKYSHYVSPDGVMLQEEYVTMSRGGRTGKGLAHGWYEEFSSDVFPSDEVVWKGRLFKPPRYYQKLFQVDDAEGHQQVLDKRKRFFEEHQADCTPERLEVRERVKLAEVSRFKRGYENGE